MTALRLFRDQRAASAAEFALVLPLLLLFLLGIIDAGRLLWTMNRAEKATQMGVRYAIVTDMVPTNLLTDDFALDHAVPGGDPVPTDVFSSTTCDESACTPDWGHNSTAFGNIVSRMRAFMPEVEPDNVEIVYENVGLGYAGTPEVLNAADPSVIDYYSPDVAPLVTVRLTDLTFQPITTMLFGLDIGLPDFKAALTLEDGAGAASN